jgi:hypothetical protein
MDLNKIACLGYDATLTITAQFLMGKKQCQGLISTYDFILSSSGILLEDDSQGLPSAEQEDVIETQINSLIEDAEGEYSAKSTEELKTMLQNALENEQYEAASKIRDEINSRKKS